MYRTTTFANIAYNSDNSNNINNLQLLTTRHNNKEQQHKLLCYQLLLVLY